ncbi:MAG TPA: sugar ABC transporter permease [Pseudothermotoga sp.]|nr:sugar ABC transporter permease [Pseudothermotoga sp.]HOK83928.1 sugar ABC transporter permease [Pseudothermotoga sp.]HPP70686.1 sugar ABC transporter permease [Pseudothermotoga sp.]
MKRLRFWIFLMLLPTFALIFFINLYPLVRGGVISFQRLTVFTLNRPRFIGFENYRTLITDPNFWNIILNTVVWIFFSVLFQLVFGFILALLLVKPFKGRGLYMGVVFYPWALSGFAIGLLWSWILNGQFGILNDILIKLHLIKQPISFLSDPRFAMFSVIMINVWYGIPFFAIMLLAALQSVPKELYEAAQIDGATMWHRLVRITIPCIKPAITSTVLLRIIWVMNFPDIIYGTTRGGPAGATNILSVQMINIVYYQNNFGKASALGIIITGVLLAFSVAYLIVAEKGAFEL